MVALPRILALIAQRQSLAARNVATDAKKRKIKDNSASIKLGIKPNAIKRAVNILKTTLKQLGELSEKKSRTSKKTPNAIKYFWIMRGEDVANIANAYEPKKSGRLYLT